MNIEILNTYSDILESSFLVTHSDTFGNVTYANKLFLNKSGYTEDEILNKPHSILKNPKTPDSIFQNLWAVIKSKNVWSGTLLNRKKDGTDWLLNASISAVLDGSNEIKEYVAIYFEIQKRDINLSLNLDLLELDALTSLPKRVVVEDEVNKIIEKKSTFSFILCQLFSLDLNKDLVLISKLFKQTLREGDILGRWSSDTLIIICQNSNIGQGAIAAERLRVASQNIDITTTFGVSHFGDNETLIDLINRANERLDSANHSGKNRVCV